MRDYGKDNGLRATHVDQVKVFRFRVTDTKGINEDPEEVYEILRDGSLLMGKYDVEKAEGGYLVTYTTSHEAEFNNKFRQKLIKEVELNIYFVGQHTWED